MLELLQKHYRVSLPGIGSFVVTSQPARIDEQNNTIEPPVQKVVFSKQETWNDGLLEAAYAARFGLTESEAQERVRHLMMDIRFELDDKGRVNFVNLGCLRQGRQNAIDLEPKVNLAEMMGLAPVPLDLNWQNGKGTRKNGKPPRRRASADEGEGGGVSKSLRAFKLKPQRIALMAAAGLVGIASSVALIALFIGRSDKIKEELLHPADKHPPSRHYELPSRDDDDADDGGGGFYEQPVDPQYDSPAAKPKGKKTGQPPAVRTPAPSPAPRPEPRAPAPSHSPSASAQYCVIVSSVTSPAAAEREVNALQSAGYRNCHIAEVKNGRYRVAIGCYHDIGQARQELAIVKRNVRDAWLLEKRY